LAAAVVAAAALFTAVGTYEPLIEAATSGDAVAIAGRYYSRLLWPVAVAGCALAVRADRRWWPAVVGAAVGGLAVPFGAGPFGWALGAAGGAVAASAVAAGLAGRRGAIAHAGAGVLLVGVAGTLAARIETVDLAAGSTATVAGVELTHRSIELATGQATQEAIATVEVGGSTLNPRLVAYRLRGVSTAEVAHRFVALDELQVVLLDGDAASARYRVNHLPRVGLVWLGGALLVAGLAGGPAAQPLRRLRASSSDTVDGSPPPAGVPAGGRLEPAGDRTGGVSTGDGATGPGAGDPPGTGGWPPAGPDPGSGTG
jgi:cytochrome c biogenesis factor